MLLHLAGRVEVVVTTGGTGIGRRDRTPEVAGRLIQKPLPGFGELFRALSFQEIGAAAMLSRAKAGLYGPEDGPPETLLFCCPGSLRTPSRWPSTGSSCRTSATSPTRSSASRPPRRRRGSSSPSRSGRAVSGQAVGR